MDKKRRFLFVIRTYYPGQMGGAAKSVRTLAEELLRRGHDVHIARLVPKGRKAEFEQAARDAGMTGPGKPTLHFLPIRNIYWPYDLAPRSAFAKAVWHVIDLYNFRARSDFARLMAEIKPDVVNTNIIDGFSPSIFGAVKSSGARLIHTMRDYYLICQRSGMFRDGKNCEGLCASCKVAAVVNRASMRHVDLFLSNSEYVAKVHADNGAFRPNQPCLVQWNANDQPSAPQGRTIGEKVVFGYIGRVAPSKGIDKALEAAAMVASGRPWELRVAGSGDEAYTRTLHEKYGATPNVNFIGWSTPVDFYGNIDVLICPSTYNEPLPRVIYEGYAYGLPVIASDIGGNPEVVRNGETGFLYPPDDIRVLAARMKAFLEMSPDEYASFSRAALAFSDQFTPTSVVDTYERRIEELIANG